MAGPGRRRSAAGPGMGPAARPAAGAGAVRGRGVPGPSGPRAGPLPPAFRPHGPSPQRPRRGRRRHGGAVPQRGDDPGPALPPVRGRVLLCQRAGRAGEGPVPRREYRPPLAWRTRERRPPPPPPCLCLGLRPPRRVPPEKRRGRAAAAAPRSRGARAPAPSAAAVCRWVS